MQRLTLYAAVAALVLGLSLTLVNLTPAGAAPTLSLEACLEKYVTAARSEHGAKLGETLCQRSYPEDYARLLQ